MVRSGVAGLVAVVAVILGCGGDLPAEVEYEISLESEVGPEQVAIYHGPARFADNQFSPPGQLTPLWSTSEARATRKVRLPRLASGGARGFVARLQTPTGEITATSAYTSQQLERDLYRTYGHVPVRLIIPAGEVDRLTFTVLIDNQDGSSRRLRVGKVEKDIPAGVRGARVRIPRPEQEAALEFAIDGRVIGSAPGDRVFIDPTGKRCYRLDIVKYGGFAGPRGGQDLAPAFLHQGIRVDHPFEPAPATADSLGFETTRTTLAEVDCPPPPGPVDKKPRRKRSR
jgi:hypothetical protein